jgi:hypothetical protein
MARRLFCFVNELPVDLRGRQRISRCAIVTKVVVFSQS